MVMRKYVNRKYVSIFLVVVVAIFLLYNYFTCPRYLNTIGLDSFKESLALYKQYKYNAQIGYYGGPLGEIYFGLIAYIPTPHNITAPEDIEELNIVVRNVNERTYNPLIRGFAVTIEKIRIYVINETEISLKMYATASPSYKKSSYDFFEYSYLVHRNYNYLPKRLYICVDYTVHAIIHPYIEGFYITAGFHLKIYSGTTTILLDIDE
jgi:hypothetical protein